MISFPLFADVAMAPHDPILGLNEAFQADDNPKKINLSIGVYCDENGKVPVLECVRKAMSALAEQAAPRTYLPIDGMAQYKRAVQTLLLGDGAPQITEKRAVTVQTLGGTGGLKVGADFLHLIAPNAKVWVSNPTWDNHKAIFGGSGFAIATYPYYDAATGSYDLSAMLSTLKTATAGDIILLHACCHNPTGVDPTSDDWAKIINVIEEQKLVPFLDIAYQGFGNGIAEDGEIIRRFAERNVPTFIASSFSKSFSLYGERVGAVTVICADADEAARVLSQMKRVVRANYSNPPTFGSAIVSLVLTQPDLRSLWEEELAGMRKRIHAMRVMLRERLAKLDPQRNFDYIVKQKGMFSYSGLSAEQVKKLRAQYSVYAVETGRICVAGLNTRNVDAFAQAMAEVLQKG
ncbi:MAG: aspartate/tyrosine/aromatic aminotransferase [Burkholderiales bacterium]|jgi:aromatic-amino-acid transaminase|nr:aspartate/tyrosine/aromatic aminotransferase [Burkholderiales bacterium]